MNTPSTKQKNIILQASNDPYIPVQMLFLFSLLSRLKPQLASLCAGRSHPTPHIQQEKASSSSQSNSKKDKLFSTRMSFKQPDFHLNMEFSSGKL